MRASYAFDCPNCGAMLIDTPRCADCARLDEYESRRYNMPVRHYTRRGARIRIAFTIAAFASAVIVLAMAARP